MARAQPQHRPQAARYIVIAQAQRQTLMHIAVWPCY